VPVVVFARAYEVVRHKLADDAIVVMRGRVDRQGEEIGLICDEIEAADDVAAREVHSLVIRLAEAQLQDRILDQIAEAAERSRGSQRLMFEIAEGAGVHRVRADPRFSVRVDDALIDDLATLVGPENLLFVRR
jgi:DNA polymerase-3 subunit alpha